MKTATGTKILGSIMGVSLIASGGATFMVPLNDAFAAPQDNAQGTEAEAGQSAVEGAYVSVANVQGAFSYNQDEITPNDKIRSMFYKATTSMCSTLVGYDYGDINNWSVEVGGDVRNPVSATLGELAQSDNAEQKVMTCACSSNQAGGGAIINAEVTGVPLTDLIVLSGMNSNANTVTFTALDGTTLSLPLSYAISHSATIAYEINGENLSASVGGTNQLWLSGAAGKLFVRDIVDIQFSVEENPPADPQFEQTETDFTNRPNVSAAIAD